MFDQLKQMQKLKELQEQLAKETVEVENRGIKVLINGKMEILEVKLNPDLSKEEQEETIKDCVNEATKKVQNLAASKMFQM